MVRAPGVLALNGRRSFCTFSPVFHFQESHLLVGRRYCSMSRSGPGLRLAVGRLTQPSLSALCSGNQVGRGLLKPFASPAVICCREAGGSLGESRRELLSPPLLTGRPQAAG